MIISSSSPTALTGAHSFRCKDEDDLERWVLGIKGVLDAHRRIYEEQQTKYGGLTKEEFETAKQDFDLNFDQLLADPEALQLYKDYCESKFVGENIRFYLAGMEWQEEAGKDPGVLETREFFRRGVHLFKTHIQWNAEHEVNVSDEWKRRLAKTFDVPEKNDDADDDDDDAVGEGRPKLTGTEYDEVIRETHKLMMTNSFPRFKQSPEWDRLVVIHVKRVSFIPFPLLSFFFFLFSG